MDIERNMTGAESNRTIVTAAFDGWRDGTSSFVDILDPAVTWTIAGSGPMAQTFFGRKAFVDEAYAPIAARFASPMKSTITALIAEGDEVVVRWDGVAEMTDGQTYRNSYAWFFTMRNGKVVEATAFLDLPTYNAALDGERLPDWPES